MLLPKPAGGSSTLSYIFIIVGILIAGAMASVYVYIRFDQASKNHLIDRAATMALMVPAADIQMLQGTSSDELSPVYQHLKTLFTEVRAVNHDVRFIYLVGKLPDGKLFFYLDSEDPASPDVSPPGQVYDEASPPMYEVLKDGRSRSDSYGDRWGSWVSGYAAVRSDDGRVIALLGIDTPAKQHFIQAIFYALLPFLLSLLLALGGSVALYIHARESEYISQRMEFLSIASHEIRLPLTGIRWALSAVLDHKTGLDPRDEAVLMKIQNLCNTLISRINNLLNASAIGMRKRATLIKKPISLKIFISAICDELALSAQARSVSLVVDPTVRDDCTIEGDPEYLHQAFLNLLSNAIKYTKDHTSVAISYRANDSMHEIRISDQGGGIKKEDVEKIFSGYHRTKEALSSGEYGTGIGLYLSLQIVKFHGGDISVEPHEGGGTTFVIHLPR